MDSSASCVIFMSIYRSVVCLVAFRTFSVIYGDAEFYYFLSCSGSVVHSWNFRSSSSNSCSLR